MPRALRTKAKRLLHQFVALRARLRKEFDSLRDIERGIKATKTGSLTEIHSTAIHEAGHAALQIALDLGCRAVSIIPNFRKGSLGFSVEGGRQDDATAELRVVTREAFYLRRAIVCYAGAEAVRQLIPTDPDPGAGASSDKRTAAKLIIHHIEGDAESIDFLFSLAKRRCALLVAHYQPEIQALARALEAKLILSGKAARKVFMRSLTKRSGGLMSSGVDTVAIRRRECRLFRRRSVLTNGCR